MNPAAPSSPLRHVPWWLWPTVLCLDAPAVAVVWQGLFARHAEVALGAHHAALLAVSVWLAYAADRWIEGWRLTEQTVRTRRHFFYMRWRWPAFAAWLGALGAALALAAATLPKREWLASLGLLAPVLLYLLSHQLLHRHHPARVPKELCVALLIAGGAALYPAAARPGAWNELFLPFAWLTTLGLLNCLLISEWEREVDLSQGQTSLVLRFAGARRAARLLPVAVAVLAALCAWLDLAAARRVSLATALGGAGLAWLARAQPRLGRERARVLADVALLAPVVLALFP